MKYLVAKVGTHCSRRILLMKGKVVVGGRVEWFEHEDAKFRWSPRRTGIIWKINPDGMPFIDMM